VERVPLYFPAYKHLVHVRPRTTRLHALMYYKKAACPSCTVSSGPPQSVNYTLAIGLPTLVTRAR